MEDVDLGDGNCISIRQEDWAAFEFHYSAWQIEKVDNARVTVINPDNWGLFATSDIGAGAIVGPCTPISWAKKAATLDSGTAMLLWENDWLKGMKQNKRGHLDVLADICDLCPRLLDFRERPPAEFRSHLRKKFTQNAFEYVDNVLVLYKTLSYANHSCWPNMQFSVPAAGSHDALRANQAGWFTALRNIRAGEEITINYKEDIVDLVERRKILYRVYGFHCACTVCKEQFCPSCGKTFEQRMRCGGCKNTYYCSRECQKSHWKNHRTSCKKTIITHTRTRTHTCLSTLL